MKYVMVMVMVMVVLFCGMLSAGETDFQSSHAKKAKVKYDKALEEAKKTYIADLKKAKSIAMKSEDLDEAMRIKNMIDSVELLSLQSNVDFTKILVSKAWVLNTTRGNKHSINFMKDGSIEEISNETKNKKSIVENRYLVTDSGNLELYNGKTLVSVYSYSKNSKTWLLVADSRAKHNKPQSIVQSKK